MIEFWLSIDLGKKERVTPDTKSIPVDRAFVARSLIALAAKIEAEASPRGPIHDDTGAEVGSWQFSLLHPSER
jgi:hypothetical protein